MTSTPSSAAPASAGAIEYVHWATATARLLPRLLDGRTTGPVFLADRRAPVSGPCAPAAADICPVTGRGRLSYPRRVPVQGRFRRARPARPELDAAPAAPAAPQRAPTSGPGRAHRAGVAGQEPPPAPGQPRPLRSPGRGDLRPYHHRTRSGSTPTLPLTTSFSLNARGLGVKRRAHREEGCRSAQRRPAH